jgi:hypothetical protein
LRARTNPGPAGPVVLMLRIIANVRMRRSLAKFVLGVKIKRLALFGFALDFWSGFLYRPAFFEIRL